MDALLALPPSFQPKQFFKVTPMYLGRCYCCGRTDVRITKLALSNPEHAWGCTTDKPVAQAFCEDCAVGGG